MEGMHSIVLHPLVICAVNSIHQTRSCFIQFPVESCMMSGDRPASNTVALHQTSDNQSEYRASCETGYELAGNKSMFICHKQQWSPHYPRCELIIADNSPLSSTGKLHVI